MIDEYDEFDIDNSYYPFIPKIKKKYYAVSDIDNGIAEARIKRKESASKFKQINFEDKKESKSIILFNHPYTDEISTYLTIIVGRADEFNKYYKQMRRVNSTFQLTIENKKICDIIGIDLNYKIDYTGKIPEAAEKLKLVNHFHNYLSNNGNELTTSYEFEYMPIEKSRYLYIDTHDSFKQMLEELSHFQEVAVDLEHHNIESYLGITCLMQISTRFTDYILDPIKLRPFMQELNIIFCNPSIVKVLHGADYDIEWLQKDFGLYIVNMFDTGQAARVLALHSFSLASLLSSYCNIIADKKYQLADWRMRPLPAEMIKYAREDTHYLLYIYDRLKHKLIEKAMVHKADPMTYVVLVHKKSADICHKQFVKPVVKSEEYYQLIARNSTLKRSQLSILKMIYKFRDYVARKLDCSPNHVLNNRVMLNIVKLPNYQATSVYLSLDKNSNFRNYVPDLIKLIEKKLIRNSEKIDKNDFKILNNNYLENMRNKFNQTKTIANKVMSTKKVSEITAEPVNVKTIKNKKSFMFNDENIKQQPNRDYQSEYNNIVTQFTNFNIVNFLSEKYNLSTKQRISKSEKVEKAEKPQFLNNKRARDENKPQPELNLPKKVADSDSDSDEDIIIPDNMKPLISQVNEMKNKLNKKK
jgi:ribonuclease D